VAQLIIDRGFQVVRRSRTVPTTRKDQILAFLSGSPVPQGKAPDPASTLLPPVILGDTMGELRRFYSLADVVFVGRTLVDLGPKNHGSDMIEPAALGKPVITGRFTGNFADVMSRFRAAEALLEVSTPEELGQAVSILLSSPDRAGEMSRRAQAVVVQEKGATERHVQEILRLLPPAKIE
jgi:3-deoxy-D-manno-octulosonic-acid transferase